MPIGKAAEMIATPSKLTLGICEAMLKGVDPHMFARKPRWGLGGGEINCNHAAWVYGHLALQFPRLIANLGGAGGVGGAGNTGTPAGAVERCSDADLARANTAMAPDRFPTLGALANFLMNNHVMMHIGQVSTWRRAMGLPSAF